MPLETTKSMIVAAVTAPGWMPTTDYGAELILTEQLEFVGMKVTRNVIGVRMVPGAPSVSAKPGRRARVRRGNTQTSATSAQLPLIGMSGRW